MDPQIESEVVVNESNQIQKAPLDLGDKYRFDTQWDIWYHHSLNDWTINGYRKIFSINNIKDFWDFHNNIECIGGINNLHFFMMRKNITPIYEDMKNRNGGVWSMLVPIESSYNVWEEIAAAMCGEYLVRDMNLITGLSINLKSSNNGGSKTSTPISVIKIWNNDRTKNDVSILPTFIKPYGNIIYKKHPLDY